MFCITGASAPVNQNVVFKIHISSYVYMYPLLRNIFQNIKNIQRKFKGILDDILCWHKSFAKNTFFVGCAKKTNPDFSKWVCTWILFCLFSTGHKKVFSSRNFLRYHKLSIVHLKFYWIFLTFWKVFKNVLHNGCIHNRDPKRRIR